MRLADAELRLPSWRSGTASPPRRGHRREIVARRRVRKGGGGCRWELPDARRGRADHLQNVREIAGHVGSGTVAGVLPARLYGRLACRTIVRRRRVCDAACAYRSLNSLGRRASQPCQLRLTTDGPSGTLHPGRSLDETSGRKQLRPKISH